MRIHRMLLFFAVALSLASGLYARPALAQAGAEPTGLKNVTISVNPEYDDPRLLVIMQGQIVGVNPPAQVRFLVPTAAEMFSAGSIDAQGKYSGGPPERKASTTPGWDEISYQLKTDTFRVEYYNPVIATQPSKQFAYDFLRLYPVSDLELDVQEPRNSSNFTVSPQGTTGKDADGLTVHVYNYTNLDVDQPKVHFDISYTRTDTNPSISNPQLNGPTGAGSASTNSTLILVLGIILVLLAAVIIWQANSKRRTAYAAQVGGRGRTRAARRANARAAKRKLPGASFCPQCGGQVESGAKFCPYCGNEIGR